jgi:hypothetical protein
MEHVNQKSIEEIGWIRNESFDDNLFVSQSGLEFASGGLH